MTDPGPEEQGEAEAEQPTLWIVHHPDPRLVGLRRVVERGVALAIGRGGLALAPGVLDDPMLSAEHARIERHGERVTVVDLGSRNGTWVNGARVSRAVLAEGDLVGFGALLLLLRSSPIDLAEEPDSPLLGVGGQVAALREQIRLVAPRDTTVLLSGEPGTGKDLAAHQLHVRSRLAGRYVPVDCAGMADGVLQSELFGHSAGAYTGAREARPGLVEQAQGGTLFLDEIGDASPQLQASLLRLLQNREYRPVGSDERRRSNARVVVATHRDLERAVAGGGFRADLWSRLNRWTIRLPPLRERREDIAVLGQRFASRFGGPRTRLGRSLAAALVGYHWPGNVRELEAVIERSAIAARGAEVLELTPWLAETLAPRGDPPAAAARMPRTAPRPRPTAEELVAEIARHDGNLRATARALSVGRTTLYRWMREAGIGRD